MNSCLITIHLCLFDFAVAGYARAQNKVPVTFTPTDLVCCRTLQGHSGKVVAPFRLCLVFVVVYVSLILVVCLCLYLYM